MMRTRATPLSVLAVVVVHRNVGVELVRDVRREQDEERRVQRVAVRHKQRTGRRRTRRSAGGAGRTGARRC